MRRSPLLLVLLALVGTTLVAAPVPASATPVDDPAIIEGEMLVRFEPGTDGSERAQARAQHDLDEVRDLPIDGVELVRFDADDDPEAKGRRLRDDRRIRWAEPNRQWTAADLVAPDDPQFAQQWALRNTGQAGGKAGADLGALEAWPLAASTAEVVVAVIDTGIDVSHPDLASQIWVNQAEAGGTAGQDDDGNGYVDDVHGWDWVRQDASVFDPDDDDHGTHVAGTIAATTGNGIGVAGVSNARIMPLKFLGPDGSGSTADAVLALDYAIKMGAHIANNSWGGPHASAALADKITEAQTAGMWVVAAAGNGGDDKIGDDIGAVPSYPASFSHDNVVSVAATDRKDALATYSNHSATSVDLGAPGHSILSLLPDGAYGSMSGTSMAAPHVAGALAHVIAAYPALSMAGAKQLLLERTEPVAALATKTVSGGRLDLGRVLGAGIDPPQLTIGDARAVEGAAGAGGRLELPLTLSAPHNGPVVVDWATGAAGDTATADVDYVGVPAGRTTIDAGATTATVTIDVVGDAVDEPDETLSVIVQDVVGAAVADGVAQATITNDDTPPPPPASGGGGGGGTPTGGAGPTGGTAPTGGGSGGTTTGGTGGTPVAEPPTEEDGTEPAPQAPLPPGAHRLAGGDRIDTAVEISRASWGDGEAASVVLARGDDYPDALAGGALAVGVDAPLLLTPRSTLPASVAAELRRVLPAGGTVRLLGGPAALDVAVEGTLGTMGYAVRRVSGTDRYATATAIADERTTAPAAIFVTTGTGFADALAASAAAGHLGGVVVLTDGPRLPTATAAYLQRHAGVPIHAIGGPAAAALGEQATSSIAGADRYATAVGVADRWFADAEVLGVATGAGFPDALAAGARLGRIGAPLVLSPPTSVPDTVGATISRAGRVELYGGEAALSEAIESVLRGLLG